MINKKYWKWGEMGLLAARLGVYQSYLSEVFHRKRKISKVTAKRYKAEARAIGKSIPIRAWLGAKHPAFKN